MIDTLPRAAAASPARRDYRDSAFLHVALIMDGNGRWAQERGLNRTHGHRAGARRVQEVVEAASQRAVGTLTLYAFSADNWRRPDSEVQALMHLFRRYLATESERCRDNDIRLSVIGRRDRLPSRLIEQIEAAERLTANCRSLHLRIALDYSSRNAIVQAAVAATRPGDFDEEMFARLVAAGSSDATPVPDVDLLVRTGGEQRLSDFLLWECAYAELLFTTVRWPDFDAGELHSALDWFDRRDRRFGTVVDAAEPPQAWAGTA